MFVIGSLALTGFPFLTGFYSKDVIIEYSYGTYTCYGLYAFVLGLATACITAFYSIRLLYLVFFTPSNNSRLIVQTLHETSIFTYIALIFLAIGSIFLVMFLKICLLDMVQLFGMFFINLSL
jgi:NADH:ubiquinone oxidoreductase subunit 5 (subunit L)/multisubunit Na+/H+ antiporter MnhA subunit